MQPGRGAASSQCMAIDNLGVRKSVGGGGGGGRVSINHLPSQLMSNQFSIKTFVPMPV